MRTIRLLFAIAVTWTTVACATEHVARIDSELLGSIDPARVGAVELVSATGEVLLRGTFAADATTSSVRRTELTAATNGTAHGDAEIRDGAILIEAGGLPISAFMTVRVDGQQALFFRTTKGGSAAIKLVRLPAPGR